MLWLLDLYQVQHREPHQPASYRLYHHRPTLLHWNQREVRRAYESMTTIYPGVVKHIMYE